MADDLRFPRLVPEGGNQETGLAHYFGQTLRMSFLKAYSIRQINRKIPTCCATSRLLMLTGGRSTASYVNKAKWPTSSTGIGSRFSTPRLMLRMAMRKI